MVCWFIYLFVGLFICLFVRSFLQLFVCSLICLFASLFVIWVLCKPSLEAFTQVKVVIFVNAHLGANCCLLSRRMTGRSRGTRYFTKCGHKTYHQHPTFTRRSGGSGGAAVRTCHQNSEGRIPQVQISSRAHSSFSACGTYLHSHLLRRYYYSFSCWFGENSTFPHIHTLSCQVESRRCVLLCANVHTVSVSMNACVPYLQLFLYIIVFIICR